MGLNNSTNFRRFTCYNLICEVTNHAKNRSQSILSTIAYRTPSHYVYSERTSHVGGKNGGAHSEEVMGAFTKNLPKSEVLPNHRVYFQIVES